MRAFRILSILVISSAAGAAFAQYQQMPGNGTMMGPGSMQNPAAAMQNPYAQGQGQGQMQIAGNYQSMGNYQPVMQPGAYQSVVQGPGEQVAYQQGATQPCSARGGASAIEGRVQGGAVIIPSGSGAH